MQHRRFDPLTTITTGLLFTFAAGASAQNGPAIPGLTGTLALEGTVDKTYEGVNDFLVKTADGIEHLFHSTKRTAVHGAEHLDEGLAGLRKGTHVVVHYAAENGEKTAVEVDRIAADGLFEMQGVVTHVDRRAGQLTVRLSDGTRETLQLSERAARDVGLELDSAAADTAVIVYYAEDAGGRVAHYFRKIRED